MSLLITIPSSYPSSPNDREVVNLYPSSSVDNEFIPINSITDGETLSNKKGKVFIYNLSFGIGKLISQRRFSTFLNGMKEVNYYWNKLESLAERNKLYYCTYGMLAVIKEVPEFTVEPLVVLAIKREHLFSIQRENTDTNKFCILINRKILTEEHSKLYRNVKKFYLDEMEQYLDFHFTNDISNICYNSGEIIKPAYKSVDDMINHSKTITEKLYDDLNPRPVVVEPRRREPQLGRRRGAAMVISDEAPAFSNISYGEDSLTAQVVTTTAITSDGTYITSITPDYGLTLPTSNIQEEVDNQMEELQSIADGINTEGEELEF